ncbi:MFS transporter [Alicyclobacillus fastidiosus]|uniref:MFS transporter n=1 Tax=Alicyclobacillus fastidiosus TaxID=392011 RepID=A0ABY6ZCA4_9BACL|nr:MFS transporter [Alicyclobacillus fastidiosus]WAH40515.1 MFS transporter [Alicyclobacillus fastidiosus]GMA61938.1 MFS transporter [Alicyclobacillus fastidiosus]
MNRSSLQLNRKAVVWWMQSATGVTQTTQFMVMPFMALYMSSHTHADPSVVGLAVGTISLTSTVLSFLGGSLADLFGRKWVMAFAMLVSTLAMLEFAAAGSVWSFFVVSVLTGLSRALFGPASQAMLTDLTPPERRSQVFGMNYWMNNIGASVGPIIGGMIGSEAPKLTFYLAAGISAVYMAVIALRFPESRRPSGEVREVRIGDAIQTLRTDYALIVFIIAGILTSVGYSQFDTTLPQFMQTLFGTHAASRDYSYIFAATGFEVVVLQFLINRFSQRLGLGSVLLVSQVIYAISFFGIGISHTFIAFLTWSVILTLGEVMAAPRLAQYISMLADERMRGAYFGANSLSNLGFFLGPFMGGVLLHHFGAFSVFGVVALFALCAGPMYRLSHRMYRHRVKTDERDGVNATLRT